MSIRCLPLARQPNMQALPTFHSAWRKRTIPSSTSGFSSRQGRPPHTPSFAGATTTPSRPPELPTKPETAENFATPGFGFSGMYASGNTWRTRNRFAAGFTGPWPALSARREHLGEEILTPARYRTGVRFWRCGIVNETSLRFKNEVRMVLQSLFAWFIQKATGLVGSCTSARQAFK